jgi:hypothetical protein
MRMSYFDVLRVVSDRFFVCMYVVNVVGVCFVMQGLRK